MEPMSYGKAQAAVVRYNSCRCVKTVARELQLNYYDCFDLADWLWNRTYGSHDDLIRRIPNNQATLPELSRPTWLEYLYTRNVTPEAAAISVGWHVNEVLRSCKGAGQWYRTRNRQPLGPKKPCSRGDDSKEKDLSPEEIYARAAAIRAARPFEPQEDKVARIELQPLSWNK